MRRTEVPLWIALILKSQNKCNIVMPDWFGFALLTEKYNQELRHSDSFSKLPWNWIEISRLLLLKAEDDLQDPPNKLRSVLQDLREARQSKARRGLRELNESNVQLDGSSAIEINEIRPFVLGVMAELRSIQNSLMTEEGNEEDSEND